jgi:hypothetical protein
LPYASGRDCNRKENTVAKKKAKPERRPADQLRDLEALVCQLNLPADFIDDDLRDCADEEAMLIYENVRNAGMEEKLAFLYHHGYELGRLEELIQEAHEAVKKSDSCQAADGSRSSS